MHLTRSHGGLEHGNSRELYAQTMPTKMIRTISLAPPLDRELEEQIARSEERLIMESALEQLSRPATAREVFLLSGVEPPETR